MTQQDNTEFQPDETYLFRFLMDNVSDSIYFKDLESRFIALSSHDVAKFHMSDRAEVIGKTDFDIFSEEHARQAFEDEQEIIRTGKPIIGIEEKETWKQQEDRWVTSTKMPFRDPDGNIIGTFGISRDITTKKEYQLKLAKSESKLKEHVQRMEQDINRARIMLNAILPTSAPSTDSFSVAFRHKPAESISGDYISFFPLRKESIGVFLGNVSGRGVSAAMFVGLLKILTDYVAEEFAGDPESYIKALNDDLEIELTAASVAATYGCFRSEKKGGASFEFASGGHPSPVVIRNNGEITMFSFPGVTALGSGNKLKPEYARVPLEQGDRVLLYSGGFAKSILTPGKQDTADNLKELLNNCHRDKLEAYLDAILEASEINRQDRNSSEDILLCGVEVK